MPRIAQDRDDLWDELRAYPIRLEVSWPAQAASPIAFGAPTVAFRALTVREGAFPEGSHPEASLPDEVSQAVIGFKPNGCASFYFGPDEVYHFNSAGELRRAFVDGAMIKAERGRLIRLVRFPTAATIELRRTELDAAAAKKFLATAQQQLDALTAALRAGKLTLTAEIPIGLGLPRLHSWLDARPAALAIAPAPHAR